MEYKSKCRKTWVVARELNTELAKSGEACERNRNNKFISAHSICWVKNRESEG